MGLWVKLSNAFCKNVSIYGKEKVGFLKIIIISKKYALPLPKVLLQSFLCSENLVPNYIYNTIL